MSPLLLERYLGAARRISRLAVGSAAIRPTIATYLVPTVLTQNDHLDGLPLGTRGGMVVRHQFPLDGEYVIRVRLLRTVIDTIRGLGEPHELEVSLDGERVRLFTIGGAQPRADAFDPGDDADEATRTPRGGAARDAALEYSMNADAALEVRLPVEAGPRTVAVAFLGKTSAQVATIRQPLLRSNIDPADTAGRRMSGAWPSGARTAPLAPGTRQAAGACLSAARLTRTRNPRARGKSWRWSPAAPIGGRSPRRTCRCCSASTRRAAGTAASRTASGGRCSACS